MARVRKKTKVLRSKKDPRQSSSEMSSKVMKKMAEDKKNDSSGYRENTEEKSKVDCPHCNNGTKIIITKGSRCTVPVGTGMRIRGPGGKRQWVKTIAFHCPRCKTKFTDLPSL